jgi:hypothetical protein
VVVNMRPITAQLRRHMRPKRSTLWRTTYWIEEAGLRVVGEDLPRPLRCATIPRAPLR